MEKRKLQTFVTDLKFIYALFSTTPTFICLAKNSFISKKIKNGSPYS